MFDKLIESEPEGANFKKRKAYFMVSTLVVGVLFLAAVVISIYAEDFALGSDRMELEALLAPADPPAAEPEPVKPRTQAVTTRETSDVPSRVLNQARTDESKFVPTSISTTPNTYMSRPYGEMKLGTTDTLGSGRSDNPPGEPATLISGPSATDEAETVKETPPPVKDIPLVKKPVIQSIGVANGKAVYLPKPPYPAAAIAVNAQGKVNVQIMIDEHGKVVSAKAVDGNPLLRFAAEQAAWKATFTPTLLSNVPVKVTGVIVYNFTRN